MRRTVSTPYFAASASTPSIRDGWALSPSIISAILRVGLDGDSESVMRSLLSPVTLAAGLSYGPLRSAG